jgi:hypothetical protein
MWVDQQRIFETAPFHPYALDDRWTGLRSFGGHGGSNGALERLRLAHGGLPGDDVARVQVETMLPQRVGRDGPRQTDLQRVMTAHSLLAELVHETGIDLPDDVRAAAYPQQYSPGLDPLGPWAEAAMTIDGEPVAFRVFATGRHWIAIGEHDGFFVALTAHRWPVEQTGLVTETEFKRYFEGTCAISEELQRRREQSD